MWTSHSRSKSSKFNHSAGFQDTFPAYRSGARVAWTAWPFQVPSGKRSTWSVFNQSIGVNQIIGFRKGLLHSKVESGYLHGFLYLGYSLKGTCIYIYYIYNIYLLYIYRERERFYLRQPVWRLSPVVCVYGLELVIASHWSCFSVFPAWGGEESSESCRVKYRTPILLAMKVLSKVGGCGLNIHGIYRVMYVNTCNNLFSSNHPAYLGCVGIHSTDMMMLQSAINCRNDLHWITGVHHLNQQQQVTYFSLKISSGNFCLHFIYPTVSTRADVFHKMILFGPSPGMLWSLRNSQPLRLPVPSPSATSERRCRCANPLAWRSSWGTLQNRKSWKLSRKTTTYSKNVMTTKN